MAINENLTQINSFTKGMNTDAAPQLLQEGQYRIAENLRFTPGDDTNQYSEVRAIDGITPFEFTEQLNVVTIYATASIRNIGIIIYQDASDGYWKVARFKDNDNTSLDVVFNSEQQINEITRFSVVTKYETEDVIKVYIATGHSPIAVLNVADSNIQKLKTQSLDDVLIYSKVTFSVPQVTISDGGNLKGALVQYSYRLYSKYLQATAISPLSRLTPLFMKNNSQDIRGILPTESSNRKAEISVAIAGNDTIREYIQIYRVTYVQNGQLPTIELVCDKKHNLTTGGTFNFIDYGDNSLQVLTLEEYNSNAGIHIIPEILESKDDILFASKIKDISQSTIDVTNVTATIQEIQASDTTDGVYTLDDNLDYNYISRPNDYDGINKFKPSLRSGESYKYGIVFYDKYGTPSKVKPLQLFQATANYDDLFVTQPSHYDGNIQELNANPVGCRIEISNMPDNAVAYEIVRRLRTLNDATTIESGVISKPIKCTSTGSSSDQIQDTCYTPSGILTYEPLYLGQNCDNRTPGSTFSQFVSPGVLYNTQNLIDIVKNNQLEIIPRYSLIDNRGDVLTTRPDYIEFQRASDRNLLPQIRRLIQLGKSPMHIGKTGTLNLIISGDYARYGFKDASDPQGVDSMAVDYCGVSVALFNGRVSGNINFDSDGTGSHLGGILNQGKMEYSSPQGSPIEIEDTYKNKYVAAKNNFAFLKPYTLLHLYDDSWAGKDIKTAKSVHEFNWNDTVIKNGDKYECNFTTNPTFVNNYKFNNFIHGFGKFYPTSPATAIEQPEPNKSYESLPTDGEFNGLGGRCILLQHESISQDIDTMSETFPSAIVCDIRRKNVGNIYDDSAGEAYYSFGDFKLIDRSIPSGTSSIDVFDGDTYLSLLEYTSCHKWYYPKNDKNGDPEIAGLQTTIIYALPLESSVNTLFTSGDLFSNKPSNVGSNVQIQPSNVNEIYEQERPLYQYNTVYSAAPTARVFYKDANEQYESLNIRDVRTYYSNTKLSGETIDVWTTFQPANYLDVDSRYGALTHLRTFHNRLFFWQENAFGAFSVNERAQITDDSNLPLLLGTGGVLTRFDYVDTIAGMRAHQHCDTQSDSTLYWFDEDHNEIKAYRDGGGVMHLSIQKGIQNLLDANKRHNSPVPQLYYDEKYKEVLCNVINTSNDDEEINSDSVVFNEYIQAFSAIYKLKIHDAVVLPNVIYTINHGDDNGLTFGKYNVKNEDNPTDAVGNYISTYLQYVVNKQPMYTKVYDNQEIVSNNPNEFIAENGHKYEWETELPGKHAELDNINQTKSIFTYREGNIRYAIPRANDAEYSERLRGKYMTASIYKDIADYDETLSYIITRFRISWA